MPGPERDALRPCGGWVFASRPCPPNRTCTHVIRRIAMAAWYQRDPLGTTICTRWNQSGPTFCATWDQLPGPRRCRRMRPRSHTDADAVSMFRPPDAHCTDGPGLDQITQTPSARSHTPAAIDGSPAVAPSVRSTDPCSTQEQALVPLTVGEPTCATSPTSSRTSPRSNRLPPTPSSAPPGCSNTIRTARSRTPGEQNRSSHDSIIYQLIEVPGKPGRFSCRVRQVRKTPGR